MIKVVLALSTFFWQNEAVTSMKIRALKLGKLRRNNEGFLGVIDVSVEKRSLNMKIHENPSPKTSNKTTK